MTNREIRSLYFEWLYDLVCGDHAGFRRTSYEKLLMYLHDTEFRYVMLKDENRAEDGMDLRYRFAQTHRTIDDADLYLEGPCSVLEMMVALALRCEENIMDDPLIGDRTGQWFWGMVRNLGLGPMTDDNFNLQKVKNIIETFLNRQYEQDGRGGLFTIYDCRYDLRDIEIWVQLCWYLDSIT